MTDTSVLVVVVTYHPGEHLDRLLRSLPGACSLPYRVVLADNGSTDGAPERGVAEHGAQLVRTGANVGYGSAANIGARTGTEPFILVSNPDVELHEGAIDELLAAAGRWERGGAFGPAIVDTNGSIYPSARALPVIAHGIGHAVLARLWPTNPWTRSYRMQDVELVERVAGWLSGSCLLLRRVAFDEVGGFDPAYFMYFEDVDLADRLVRKGWASVYVPSARVMHVGATSTSQHSVRMLQAHHESAYRYLRDRYPSGWHWFFRVGLAARSRILVWRAGRRDVPVVTRRWGRAGCSRDWRGRDANRLAARRLRCRQVMTVGRMPHHGSIVSLLRRATPRNRRAAGRRDHVHDG